MNEIPKSFTLGAVKFTTEIKNKVYLNSDEVGGMSDSYKCTIDIAETVGESNVSEDSKRQIFYHELVHQILDMLGNCELSENEEFVQCFSVLLDQFEQTKEF